MKNEVKLTDELFKDPLWKLSAEIADAMSYCGPTKFLGHNKETETNYIFGFEIARATRLVHKILEQELPKIKV